MRTSRNTTSLRVEDSDAARNFHAGFLGQGAMLATLSSTTFSILVDFDPSFREPASLPWHPSLLAADPRQASSVRSGRVSTRTEAGTKGGVCRSLECPDQLCGSFARHDPRCLGLSPSWSTTSSGEIFTSAHRQRQHVVAVRKPRPASALSGRELPTPARCSPSQRDHSGAAYR